MKTIRHLPLDFFARRRLRIERARRVHSILRAVVTSLVIFRRRPRRVLCRVPIAG